MINHLLLGQAPLQLNQLLLLPKFNKKTDTVEKQRKNLTLLTITFLMGKFPPPFQPSANFISLREIYKLHNYGSVFPSMRGVSSGSGTCSPTATAGLRLGCLSWMP